MSTTYKKLKYDGYEAAVEVAIKDGTGANIATSIASKQDTLSASQLAAANSGITAEKVTKLDNLDIAWEQIQLPTPTVVSSVSTSGSVTIQEVPGANSYEIFADGTSIGEVNG